MRRWRNVKMTINTEPMASKTKEYVSWSDSYSMGVKIVDDQHKGLLNFVNDLFNHATGKEDEERAYFKEVITKALQYIKMHFQTEEKLMMMTRFPGYAEHKKAHEDFKLEVIRSVKDFDSGKQLVLEKFACFLKDWVLTHIAIVDRKYAEYFKIIATRKADGKLSITKEDIGM
jgi:hemerythrin